MSDTSIFRLKEVGNLLKETQTSVMDVQLNLTYLSQSVESTMRVVTGITIGQTIVRRQNLLDRLLPDLRDTLVHQG